MQGSVSTGHPVDIGSGLLWTEAVDCKIEGKFPLEWVRRYSTGQLSEPAGQFGPGWTCPFFARLTRVGADWHFRNPEGALVVLPDPDDAVNHGKVVRSVGDFTEVAKEGFFLKVTTWTTNSGEVLRYVFKPGINGQFWPLLALENPVGQGLEFAWDDQGRLKGVRQRTEKRTLAVECRADGRIVSVHMVHPDGRRTQLFRYDYDAKARLIAAFDALGFAERYEYASDDRMTREIGKDGSVFNFRFDDKGRCIRTTGPAGYDLKALRYLDVPGITEVTNSLGHTTRYKRLPSGQISEVMYPSGGISKTEYDAFGRIIKEENAIGSVTAYEFDDRGNRCKVIDPLGNETKYEFTDWHGTLSLEDAGGNKWSREFDAAKRIVKMVDPLGNTFRVDYDPAGNPVKVVNPIGDAQTRVFTANGVLAEATDWMGNRSSYRFDDYGRVVQRIDPLGGVGTVQYDLMGRVVRNTYPDGTFFQAQYDGSGNMTRYAGRNGEASLFRYGYCGRLLEKKDRAGNVLRYDWSTEPHQLMAIRNRQGETFRFAYDAEKRVTMEKGFDGSEMRFKYDAAGNLTRVTTAEGKVIQYVRNAAGKTVECIMPEGSVTYKYDYRNRVLESANPEIKVANERDALGRIVKETQGAHGWERTFDPMGRVVSLKSDLGADFGFMYDGNDGMTGLEIAGHGLTTFTRNPMGLAETQTLPGGFVLDQKYDGLGRLLEQQGRPAPDGAGGLAGPADPDPGIGRQYAYGPQAEVLAIRDKRWGQVRYTYDKMDRLTRAAWDNGPVEDFFYDAEGHLLRLADGIGERSATYGPGGRIARMGDTAYEYDSVGRMTGRKQDGEAAGFSYAWDSMERMTFMTTPSGESWSYGYDSQGYRVRKEGQGRKLGYVWYGDLILHEFDGETATTFAYDDCCLKPLAMIQGGVAGYIINDHLQTPREMVDGRGKLLWAARYRAYGAMDSELDSGMKCPLRFKGQWYDAESGLHYNTFRYYDPDLGRYLSPDPIRLLGSMDAYGYAINPINFCDPLGWAVEHQVGTFSELTGKANRNDDLDAHEMIRHAYLAERERTGDSRHRDNPSIALTRDQHNDVHRHENDVRRERLGAYDRFAKTYCEEISIMREAMTRAGVPEDKIAALEEAAKKFAGVKCK